MIADRAAWLGAVCTNPGAKVLSVGNTALPRQGHWQLRRRTVSIGLMRRELLVWDRDGTASNPSIGRTSWSRQDVAGRGGGV